MNYKEIIFTINPSEPFRDILLAYLSEDPVYCSFFEDGMQLKAYLLESDYNKLFLDEICDKINADISYKTSIVKNQNWNSCWESSFDPVQISDNCIVRASFHKKSSFKHEIIITPRMSFGTGHHPTTYLMLQEMLSLSFLNKRVLDMGCGTGVLSVLAEKLGASHIQAIDVSQDACLNAIDNFSLNLSKKIQISIGGSEMISGDFDYILANINTNVLLNDMRVYSNVLINKGVLLLSGFYRQDLDLIKSKANSLNLKYMNHREKENWIFAQFQKLN